GGEGAREAVRHPHARYDAEAAEKPSPCRPLARERRRRPGGAEEAVAASRDADAHGQRSVGEAARAEGQVLELIAKELLAPGERQPVPRRETPVRHTPLVEGSGRDTPEERCVTHGRHPRGSPSARSASSVRRISDVPDEMVTERE